MGVGLPLLKVQKLRVGGSVFLWGWGVRAGAARGGAGWSIL